MIYLGDSPVGVAVGVGEFTQYEKKTLTFANAENSNEWAKNPSIPCSFAPKFVVFYSNSQSTQGCIYAGQLFFGEKGGYDIKHGAVKYINLSSGADSSVLYNYKTANGNVNYYVDENNVLHIDRASGNGFWSNTYEYTFEIYG